MGVVCSRRAAHERELLRQRIRREQVAMQAAEEQRQRDMEAHVLREQAERQRLLEESAERSRRELVALQAAAERRQRDVEAQVLREQAERQRLREEFASMQAAEMRMRERMALQASEEQRRRGVEASVLRVATERYQRTMAERQRIESQVLAGPTVRSSRQPYSLPASSFEPVGLRQVESQMMGQMNFLVGRQLHHSRMYIRDCMLRTFSRDQPLRRDAWSLQKCKWAIQLVLSHAESHANLTTRELLRWHALFMDGLLPSPGLLRNRQVHVGNHRGTEPRHVKKATREFVKEANLVVARQDISAAAKAAWCSFQIVNIHPFIDGNGRLSRLLGIWSLARHAWWWGWNYGGGWKWDYLCLVPFFNDQCLHTSRRKYISAIRSCHEGLPALSVHILLCWCMILKKCDVLPWWVSSGVLRSLQQAISASFHNNNSSNEWQWHSYPDWSTQLDDDSSAILPNYETTATDIETTTAEDSETTQQESDHETSAPDDETTTVEDSETTEQEPDYETSVTECDDETTVSNHSETSVTEIDYETSVTACVTESDDDCYYQEEENRRLEEEEARRLEEEEARRRQEDDDEEERRRLEEDEARRRQEDDDDCHYLNYYDDDSSESYPFGIGLFPVSAFAHY